MSVAIYSLQGSGLHVLRELGLFWRTANLQLQRMNMQCLSLQDGPTWYTLVGGFLIGNSFSAREDAKVFLTCVELELRVAKDIKDQESHILFLATTIARSLGSPEEEVVRMAAGFWLRLVQNMDKVSATRGFKWPSSRHETGSTLKLAEKNNPIYLTTDYPCGSEGSGGQGFFVHFLKHIPN